MNTLDPILGSDFDSFLIRLNQTIQWCSRPGRSTDPKTCLRTKALETWVWADGQKITFEEAGQLEEQRERDRFDHDTYKYWFWNKERTDLVDRIAANRANSLNQPVLSPATTLANGRLVTFWPDSCVAMGNSEAVTNGFFTVLDEPPWDTWVAFFHEEGGYLLSWVPPEFMESVTKAVTQSADGALVWIDDFSPEYPVYKVLKQKGLL